MTSIIEHVQIRWCIKSDHKHLALIDRKTFGHKDYWSAKIFKYVQNIKTVIILTCEINENICGYCAYELCQDKIRIIRIAVDSNYRNYGIGSEIINRLYCKLSTKRPKIEVTVPYELAEWFINVCCFSVESHDTYKSVLNLSLECEDL